MAFTKYLLPTLAIAGAALAQCDQDITIHSSGDAAAISGCTTYSGDVTIASDAAGEIQLNGIQQLKGNLKCNNATQLSSITADQLNSIAGIWSLTGLTILSNLGFSSLTNVANIEWIGLPALQGLNFPQGVQTAQTVYISNTQLNSLAGIELQQVKAMDINNNPYLNTVNVNDLTNVTELLSFSANSQALTISFPNLQAGTNMTFRNVSGVDIPSLSQVNGNMGFYSGTQQFDTFSAPNLTLVDGTLAFVDSPALSNISMPSLKGIGGGLLIANNTKLMDINGFPKLQVIVGALDFAGSFSKISLPSLKDVRGGSNVQTSSSKDICSLFNTDHDKQIIKGVNTCLFNKQNPDTNPSATSGGTSSSSTSTSSNSAAGFDPSAPFMGLAALIAALLFL